MISCGLKITNADQYKNVENTEEDISFISFIIFLNFAVTSLSIGPNILNEIYIEDRAFLRFCFGGKFAGVMLNINITYLILAIMNRKTYLFDRNDIIRILSFGIFINIGPMYCCSFSPCCTYRARASCSLRIHLLTRY